MQHATAKLVCLNWRHDDDAIDEIRRITQERVLARGDNHQTIHAATDKNKYLGIMEGFINRFERCSPHSRPDDGFDVIIDLDPAVGSRMNLETVVKQLQRYFPNLVKETPSSEQLDAAIEAAIGYKPDFKHELPDRTNGGSKKTQQPQPQENQRKSRQNQLEYMSIDVPANAITAALDQAFQGVDPKTSRFYMQLKQTRRVQNKFHVTLMHRATAKQHPELWKRYTTLHDASAGTEDKLDECGLILERVVFDDRIMAIVVRLIDAEGKWDCVNRVAHITVGTRDSTVKPKESNDLLARWLDDGVSDGGIVERVFEPKPTVVGAVRGVASR
ncbi:hypothetical protein ACCO45_003078 [Purpureocillium lilacinum]|uniref:Uncharacterized protein n=1 Tax=Purpureocillium lilacinum TaxID=33203 RepID=A0ACC4DYX2_PURLI